MAIGQTIRAATGVLIFGAAILSAQPTVTGAYNAADYSNDLAAGATISILGSGFTTSIYQSPGYPLPVSLGGVSVQVTSGTTTVPVPLFLVSPTRINGQLPFGLQDKVDLTVVNAAGTSRAVSLTLSLVAPKFFTTTDLGEGYIVAAHADGTLVSRRAPATPGETVTLYMNSMGPVLPPISAGALPGEGGVNNPFNVVVMKPTVLLDTLASNVVFAGLAPRTAGVYQVNFVTPYDDKFGDAAISVTQVTTSTQGNVTLQVYPNGFYWAVSGGRFVNGQTLNGAPGSNSSLAFRHNSPSTFGSAGFESWTKSTALATSSSAIASLALTLKSGPTIVFDNNGIESGAGAVGTYYTTAPGYNVFFAMSNLSSPTSGSDTLQGVYSGYFRLNATTTFDQLIGYFEGPLNVNPSFDPANIYNTYHVNIFSNVGGVPKETGSYKGDVFSSDSTAGTFSYGATGVERVDYLGSRIPTYRLVYTLKAPVTLPAGEYWFTHDVSTPATGTGITGIDRPAVPASRLKGHRPSSSIKQWNPANEGAVR